MDESPSNMIINEIASEDDAPIDVHPAKMTNDTNTHIVTRGGRSIKSTQKFQEIEWKIVKGRGKHLWRGHCNCNFYDFCSVFIFS